MVAQFDRGLVPIDLCSEVKLESLSINFEYAAMTLIQKLYRTMWIYFVDLERPGPSRLQLPWEKLESGIEEQHLLAQLKGS